LPSHTPLPDTIDLINLFTPFTVATHLSQPTTDSDSAISQTHTITLFSPGKYLTATVDMVVSSSLDSLHASIDSVSVTSLSSWADLEVGKWIRQKAAERDVPCIGYGLGRYWDICLRRGKCWTRICREYPQLVTSAISLNSESKSKKRKRDDQTGEFKVEDIAGQMSWPAISLASKGITLSISWDISLDWAGDIGSNVGARAQFPYTCKTH
jgi:hypothetical protein